MKELEGKTVTGKDLNSTSFALLGSFCTFCGHCLTIWGYYEGCDQFAFVFLHFYGRLASFFDSFAFPSGDLCVQVEWFRTFHMVLWSFCISLWTFCIFFTVILHHFSLFASTCCRFIFV